MIRRSVRVMEDDRVFREWGDQIIYLYCRSYTHAYEGASSCVVNLWGLEDADEVRRRIRILMGKKLFQIRIVETATKTVKVFKNPVCMDITSHEDTTIIVLMEVKQ